jgi:hypothetical protein
MRCSLVLRFAFKQTRKFNRIAQARQGSARNREKMTLNAGASRGQRMFKIGLWWHILGCGPLYLMILLSWVGVLERDINPIGPGLLAFFSFWPSLILMIVGALKKRKESRG